MTSQIVNMLSVNLEINSNIISSRISIMIKSRVKTNKFSKQKQKYTKQ